MRVAVDDQLDVLGLEPERADARVDERNGLRQRAINEHEAGVGYDQHG